MRWRRISHPRRVDGAILSPLSRATALNNLGDLLREEDRISEARSCFERALATGGISWDQRYSAIVGSPTSTGYSEPGTRTAKGEQRARKWQASADLYAKVPEIFESVREDSGALQNVASMSANVLSQLHRGREAKQVVAEVTVLIRNKHLHAIMVLNPRGHSPERTASPYRGSPSIHPIVRIGIFKQRS